MYKDSELDQWIGPQIDHGPEENFVGTHATFSSHQTSILSSNPQFDKKVNDDTEVVPEQVVIHFAYTEEYGCSSEDLVDGNGSFKDMLKILECTNLIME